ncbi:alpha/beta hydrolase [Halobacillus rhizosphaerae]|uniref:alpha/beta fold hydrolase n=1 Tax=Halobacillus rhizosphaerae TaxID=3064889 RepID=UPI00398B2B2D
MPDYKDELGRRLFYEDIGEGEPLVFIHPPGMGRKVFIEQHPLAKHYRLILPDLSGHGDSDVVNACPDLSFFAKEIKQLLDHLQLEKVVLVGYSCGGMISQEFALTYPSRLKALILSGGFPKVDTFGLQFEFFGGIRWVQKDAATLAWLLSKSHFRGKDFKYELREHMEKSDPSVWLSYYKHAQAYDCTSRLNELKMPLLLLYGEKEVWINHHSRFYHQCEDASLTLVDQAFHQIPATHPHIFNPAVHHFIQRKVSPA